MMRVLVSLSFNTLCTCRLIFRCVVNLNDESNNSERGDQKTDGNNSN